MTDPRPEETAILATLAAVARRIAATEAGPSPDADPQLLAIARTAALVLDAQAASIALHDAVTDRLVFVAAAGPAAGDVVGMAIDSATGIAGYAFTTGQPLAVADVATDARFDRRIADATGYVPRSLLATPMADEDGIVGVLEVLDRRGDGATFTLRDLDVAAALAAVATAAVRTGRARHDTARLMRDALVGVLAAGDDGRPMDAAAIDTVLIRITTDLDAERDDPTWRLADRLARLRDVEPDTVELAIEWLDALLRRPRR